MGSIELALSITQALAVASAGTLKHFGFDHVTQDEGRVQMLADLLLCSQHCVLRMACKCPELLTMSLAEVTQRLMLLKVLPCTAMATSM